MIRPAKSKLIPKNKAYTIQKCLRQFLFVSIDKFCLCGKFFVHYPLVHYPYIFIVIPYLLSCVFRTSRKSSESHVQENRSLYFNRQIDKATGEIYYEPPPDYDDSDPQDSEMRAPGLSKNNHHLGHGSYSNNAYVHGL